MLVCLMLTAEKMGFPFPHGALKLLLGTSKAKGSGQGELHTGRADCTHLGQPLEQAQNCAEVTMKNGNNLPQAYKASES